MSGEIYKTIRSYDGESGGKAKTLQFSENEFIEVVKFGTRGWLQGILNGSKGWFPAKYVQKAEQNETFPFHSQMSKTVKEKNNSTEGSLSTATTQKSFDSLLQLKEDDEILKTKRKLNDYIQLTEPITDDESAELNSNNQVNSASKKYSDETQQNDSAESSNTSVVLFKTYQASSFQSILDLPSTYSLKTKPQLIQIINGLSFTSPENKQNQKLLHSTKRSFCDNFWGDAGGCSGFHLVYKKVMKEKALLSEISKLLKARELVEEQYAKGLKDTALSSDISEADGDLGYFWVQLKDSILKQSKTHQEFGNKIKHNIREPFEVLKESKYKESKKVNSIVNDLRLKVFNKFQDLEMIGEKLIAQTNLVEKYTKNQAKNEEIIKIKASRNAIALELQRHVKMYNKVRNYWYKEVVTSLLFFENQEKNRIEKTIALMKDYIKIASNSPNIANQANKALMESLNNFSAEKEMDFWIRQNCTGQNRPVDIEI